MARRKYNFDANRCWKDMTPEDAEILAHANVMPSEALEHDHEDYQTMRMIMAHAAQDNPYPWSKASGHHFYMAGSWEDVPSEAHARCQSAGL